MLISAHPRTSSSRATPASRKSSSRPGVARSTCTCHQRSSAVIRGHQRSSKVLRGHPRSSEVIRGHPRLAVAVITPSASREICISRGAPPYTQADSMPRGRPVAIADAISRNQSPSDAISRHQSSSDAISRHQSSSVVMQSSSVVISRHQSSSVAISRAPKRRHSASIWSASSRVGAMMSVVSTGNTRAVASRTIEANAGSR